VGKEPRQHGLLGDAPVADDPNLIDGLRLLGQGCAPAESASASNEHRCAPGGSWSASAREMEMCLIFTGLEPCGEHKYWCGP
jgi:hypothetical protein